LDIIEGDHLVRLFRERRVDLKKLDAIEVVRKVAELAESLAELLC
jgi:hypothetical protein